MCASRKRTKKLTDLEHTGLDRTFTRWYLNLYLLSNGFRVGKRIVRISNEISFEICCCCFYCLWRQRLASTAIVSIRCICIWVHLGTAVVLSVRRVLCVMLICNLLPFYKAQNYLPKKNVGSRKEKTCTGKCPQINRNCYLKINITHCQFDLVWFVDWNMEQLSNNCNDKRVENTSLTQRINTQCSHSFVQIKAHILRLIFPSFQLFQSKINRMHPNLEKQEKNLEYLHKNVNVNFQSIRISNSDNGSWKPISFRQNWNMASF